MSDSLTNVTLDDTSSFITYIGDWDGTVHNGDPFIDRYSNGTFRASSTIGDSASLFWTGGSIWIYGALRSNHGYYSISIDNSPKEYLNGANMPDIFDQTIFQSGELENGDHKVVIMNEAEYNTSDPNLKWFDLDYIVVQADAAQFDPSTSNSRNIITTGAPRVQAVMPPTGTPIPIKISGATDGSSIGFEAFYGLLFFILYLIS